nr:nucleoside hydrolase [Paracoccaceae bacterium]
TERLAVAPSREAPATRLWVDTDAACGLSPRSDPDDCLALLSLARAGKATIAGISTVFGNADISRTDATTRELVARLRASGHDLPEVHRGAGRPLGANPDGTTHAAVALAAALREGPLTILALGPLTNVTATLQAHPDLAREVERVVAVMGRRPGHLFHPSEGKGDGLLFGHGPVFSDLNVRKDPEAARRLLATGVAITLIPYEAARDVIVTPADLHRLAASGPAGAWVAAATGGWMRFWQEEVGLPGFYPFDLVAAAHLRDPAGFMCTAANAQARRGWAPEWLWPINSAGLIVTAPVAEPSVRQVTYCPELATGASVVRFD